VLRSSRARPPQHISPLGALRQQYISSCSGDPANYNQLTHECRVDATSARRDVLSTRMTVRHFPGTHAVMRVEPRGRSNTTHLYNKTFDYWFGSEVRTNQTKQNTERSTTRGARRSASFRRR